MSYKTGLLAALLALAALSVLVPAVRGSEENQWFVFPTPLPPDEYGNILISRTSEKNGVKPATFSHWVHRRKFTCRVCHFELEFNFKVNTTEITEAANKTGKYCGAPKCHDGTAAFGHGKKEDCDRCHNGKLGYGKEKFAELAALPKRKLGNGIDWAKALDRGLIQPANELTIKPSDITYDQTLSLQANWAMIPPAIFSHRAHVKWLDCNNCHPDIFNIKKKTTKHFSMELNLKGDFCGVCHLSVALPMDDCKKCHPGIKK
jgi:c(7)-type cytochrome triheme protein